LVALPAFVSLLFASLAFDQGSIGAVMLYLGLTFLSVLYILRPMAIIWFLLFCAFLGYSLLMASMPFGAGGEWFLYLLFGLVPMAALGVARPRALEQIAPPWRQHEDGHREA
jgi:hypothetical protein